MKSLISGLLVAYSVVLLIASDAVANKEDMALHVYFDFETEGEPAKDDSGRHQGCAGRHHQVG